MLLMNDWICDEKLSMCWCQREKKEMRKGGVKKKDEGVVVGL